MSKSGKKRKVIKMAHGKYVAVGFVEALIAIAVAGIASIVLMSIAANTTAQVIRNEISGEMTEYAIEGAAIIRKIADNHNNGQGELFPSIEGNNGRCFSFEGSTDAPRFVKSGENFTSICSYDSGERVQCKDSTLDKDEDMFRLFCLAPESDAQRDLVVGKVVVGLKDCDSVVANTKCEISDYEYYVAVKVIQD